MPIRANWWENFFHGVALDFWRAAISAEQTRAEADFINNQLQLPVGAKVLDVPCGNGRLAIELAAFGFELTGVDIAKEFIDEAMKKSSARGVSIDWRNGEMRALPWTNEFDGAFCFGNSFGYLDDAGNVEFLQAVSRTLKPGARLIIDAPAIAECLLPHLLEQRTIQLGDISATIDTRYDHEQGRMFNDFTFTRDGIEDRRPSSQRIYTYRELAELLRGAGLEPVAAYGSLTGEKFKLGSQRMLLVAEKAEGERAGQAHLPDLELFSLETDERIERLSSKDKESTYMVSGSGRRVCPLFLATQKPPAKTTHPCFSDSKRHSPAPFTACLAWRFS